MENNCWDYNGHTICLDSEGYFVIDNRMQVLSYDEAIEYIDEVARNTDLPEYDEIHTYTIYFVDRNTDRKASVDVTATNADEAMKWVKRCYCPNCRIIEWEMYE